MQSAKWLKSICDVWSVGFGSGYLPVMPGTWGSMLAVPIYLALSVVGIKYYLVCVIALILFSVYASAVTAKRMGQKDPSCIVCDEIVGMLCVLPFCHGALGLLLGFACFRLFDITKPWPICKVDGCGVYKHTGLMIVLDDLIAACYAILLVYWLQQLLAVIAW